ncbi:IS21 family transposase, partial [Myxococcus sp. K15C18031901]|uniref:Mu transposase domain-containing protein n=1 Tax=Myxococcus dinghuensis TaxID=2906761 RepID=UPI0020A6E5F5
AFPHLLCHPVLPYSNWEWATVCQSESMAAIKRGVQAALFQLGRVPRYHQTDNSTSATHRLEDGKRGFNADYRALMAYFGMEPRTIEVGEKQQNGDVEALNGAFKRRLVQHLLVRGSADFSSAAEYEAWVQGVALKANGLRAERLAEELAAMRPLSVESLPEYTEVDVLVTGWSTVRVKHNTYSVPSRLVGERVRVRLYDERLEVLHRGALQLTVERLHGRNGHRINYRHIIWSLVQKPGAFAQYRYRQDLFPSLVFRRTYDSLRERHEERRADMEYLRILHLAASTMESTVQATLERMLASGGVRGADAVKAQVAPETCEVPHLEAPQVDLRAYDALLDAAEEVAS